MTLDLSNLTASAFLDRNGQYAKREEDVQVVRLYVGDAVSAEMTFADFQSLPECDQQTIRDAGVSVKVNL